MDTGLTSDYIAALNEEAEQFAAKIVSGRCTSFEEYRHDVGVIKGLQTAERTLHDTIKHITDRQELDTD